MRHYDIFDYWKDKCITESGEVEIDYGYDGCDKEYLDSINSIEVVTDWGEPSCFCCNKWTGVDDSNVDLKTLWNSRGVTSKLDRAHIIPSALGGELIPENMFCLCPECHRESPDTIYKQEFFRWVYNRRKRPKRVSIYKEAVKQCDKEGIYPIFSMGDVNINTCNTHGGGFADSTYVAALVGAARLRTEAIKRLGDVI
jgi:hypothetical protein